MLSYRQLLLVIALIILAQPVSAQSPFSDRSYLNVAGMGGIWIPTGELTRVGVHPELGCRIGGKFRKVTADVTIAFKFLNSFNSYQATKVHSDKQVVTTRSFFGGYWGIDAGYAFYFNDKQELQALIGGGIDGWDAVKEDKARGIKSESTWTPNVNFGLGHRYYFDNGNYIGVQAKYNVVNYALNNVVDFTGNPITFTVIFGHLQ